VGIELVIGYIGSLQLVKIRAYITFTNLHIPQIITKDLLTSPESTTAPFADDTAVLATDSDPATNQTQSKIVKEMDNEN
jgi:hypothetical protein